jgi:hypothetical protein
MRVGPGVAAKNLNVVCVRMNLEFARRNTLAGSRAREEGSLHTETLVAFFYGKYG